MFRYHLKQAWHHLGQHRLLTLLMILSISIGIGACMTSLTVYHVLARDPIPEKSDRLFYPQMDPRSMQQFKPGQEPMKQLTRFDAEALLREAKGKHQAVMSGGEVIVTVPDTQQKPKFFDSRFTSRDFFALFDVPFAYGRPWSVGDDEHRARVLVISSKVNDEVFGGGDNVGKVLRIDETPFEVVGILKKWEVSPLFYDVTRSSFGANENIYIPYSAAVELELRTEGDMSCWKDREGGPRDLHAPCAWLQYWVELDPAEVENYRSYLEDYVQRQKDSGRFERPVNIRFRNVTQWLEHNKVVPTDVQLRVWISFGFLLVCLVNSVGLLLTKFLRRTGPIGIHRALGASRRDILLQLMVETGLVGVAGGVFGMALAILGLMFVRSQPDDYARLARLDWNMFTLNFVLAVTSALAAGFFPAWRASRISPAIQLKAQ